MGKGSSVRIGGGKSVTSWIAVFALLFTFISSAFPPPAWAKSSRAALVAEVTGDVTYKKAGGSRSNVVYTDLKLNQGDYISVGASSSVVLKIVDHGDEVTIDENSEVYISDLLDEGKGKVTKLKSWAGSIWTKVKSLISWEDSFELETPTGVMGVRGTNFWQRVNPLSGQTSMVVASGVVRAKTVTATQNEATRKTLQESKFVDVYPAQQILLDFRSQAEDLKTKVEVVNVGDLVNNASPKVIEKIVRGVSDIQEENALLRERLMNDLNNGIQKPADNANLLIKDITDLNKVTSNFNNIVGNIANQAVETNKIDKAELDKLIEEANKQIENAANKLDLNKVRKIDPAAGLDPEVEKAKQAAAGAQARLTEEQRQLLENQRRFAALLDKMEADKRRLDEANKQAAKAAAERAAEHLQAQLDEAAKRAFEDNRKKNEEARRGGTVTLTPVSNVPGKTTSANDDQRPPMPTLTSPTSATVSASPVQVKLSAPSFTTIQLLAADGTVIGSAEGNDSAEVTIRLTLLEGVHYLTARTIRGSNASLPVSLPAITVVAPAVPELISPLTDTAFDLGMIKVYAKARVGETIRLLNGSQELASATGLGDTPVELSPRDNNYTGLTLVSEKSGIRSAAKPVPKLSNKPPAVTLNPVGRVQPDGTVKFTLEMKNFTNKMPVYAIQAHMVYNAAELDYTAENVELSDVPGTVFDGSQTMSETLRQVAGNGRKELIYAATSFEAPGSSVDNIILNGSKPLVSFVLKTSASAANVPSVRLVYVKVVDKNGDVVYELNE